MHQVIIWEFSVSQNGGFNFFYIKIGASFLWKNVKSYDHRKTFFKECEECSMMTIPFALQGAPVPVVINNICFDGFKWYDF